MKEIGATKVDPPLWVLNIFKDDKDIIEKANLIDFSNNS
jgi:hypothetical protein